MQNTIKIIFALMLIYYSFGCNATHNADITLNSERFLSAFP
jgi:hypothetical protein